MENDGCQNYLLMSPMKPLIMYKNTYKKWASEIEVGVKMKNALIVNWNSGRFLIKNKERIEERRFDKAREEEETGLKL